MAEIAAGAADFISMCSVVNVGESGMKSTYYNYQSFFPGKSCESIYNINTTKDHLDTTGSQVKCTVG